jgi:hypothetical protein
MWSYKKLDVSKISDFSNFIKTYMGNGFYVQRNNYKLVP